MPLLWRGFDAGLDPTFRQSCEGEFALLPYTYAVTRGLASRAEQAALYSKYLAGGPLAAKPGHSAHEYGLAIDVAVVEAGGEMSWAEGPMHPAWPALWAMCKASPDLHSGHFFPPIAPADDDHVQATTWDTVKKPALRAAGEW